MASDNSRSVPSSWRKRRIGLRQNETKQLRKLNTEKKAMKKATLLAAAIVLAGAIGASAADAKENWEKNCAKCHGADGVGKTKMGEKLGVKDYTDAKVQSEMKDEEMFKAIKEGVKKDDQTKMKAFGEILSDDEIKALVAYVRGFKK